MAKATLLKENNELLIKGTLDFTTVAELWKDSLPLLAGLHTININLSGVTSANSAGLALLLEWLKYADHQNKKIIFENLPDQLMSVAKLVDMEGLFPL